MLENPLIHDEFSDLEMLVAEHAEVVGVPAGA
jgi:hypothetical protein